MKKVVFKPQWANFDLPPTVEGYGVNITPPIRICSIFMLDPGESQVELSSTDLPHITRVRKNGVDEAYAIEGNILSLAPTPNSPAVLEIDRSGQMEFSVFAGSLVPGISFDDLGKLRGIVGNIPSFEPVTYRFGLRARWNGLVADVVKEWEASPVDNRLAWNTETLPSAIFDSGKVTGRPFYSFGEFRRGQRVEIGIDVVNPDATPLTVLARAVPEMVEGAKHFSGVLPLELEIKNDPFTIEGFIPAEAVPGEYFVELWVDEPLAPVPIIVHFNLLSDQFDRFTAINRLNWITATDLGTMREGHPSHFTVSANNTTGASVTYMLAPGSRPLPVGMALSPNGEIRGRAPHVPVDTTFEIMIKAASGPYVSTKTFKFRVLNSFARPKHLTVSLPLSGPIRRAWQTYSNQISNNRRYRPTDPHYGSAMPKVLLIRGLRNRPVTGLEYDEPFDTILGPFKVAQAVAANGKVLYDVIYREFFDPMWRAGGFVHDKVDVIESPVYHAQNQNLKITEGTLRNLRGDLVIKIGLNANAIRRNTLGPSGGELLDLWMMSPQTNGQPIGYIGAGVIDYVEAGRGQRIAAGLDYGDLPVGKVVEFDRLLVDDGVTPYFHYLGWDRNEYGDVEAGAPSQPLDYRVDGIPYLSAKGKHPEPVLTWAAAELEVTYRLKFWNGPTLLREVGTEDTKFIYSTAMQTADGSPGQVRVELTAERDGKFSLPLTAAILIRAGWGFSWGFHYGGTA
jgi:hypothetical protein